jgi:hypothetical protein
MSADGNKEAGNITVTFSYINYRDLPFEINGILKNFNTKILFVIGNQIPEEDICN